MSIGSGVTDTTIMNYGRLSGIAFANLPPDWVCPECGVGKEEFSPVA
jgi:rubredoxin